MPLSVFCHPPPAPIPTICDQQPAYLGNFQPGRIVVVAPSLAKGPVSGTASKDE
ncbi:hypothetical protein [Roseovarius sp. D22-M7]|uniref:hypothetical protein n=1 Tax=Roseovarius sp. D22-M7 TaxID=3127116 RepID=UPI0030101FF1